MGIHMNLDYHEPPGGDFVALIDHMVGPPPSDPELAAKELSARLAARARRQQAQNSAEADTMYGENDYEEASAAIDDGPPDVGDALRSLAGNSVRGVMNGASKLLIAVGFIIVAATIFLDMNLPIVEPLHGMVALISGIFLNNATSNS
jgi:hypothetical protein